MKKMKTGNQAKRFIAAALAVAMMLSLCACGVPASSQKSDPALEQTPQSQEAAVPTETQTRVFTDSAGRKIELPTTIDKIAVSGSIAQIVLFALCPDRLVGVSGEWNAEALPFLDEKYLNLPKLGQLYGGKGDLNLETLLESGAQIVIDVGETKDSVAEDLDALTKQTGIPFVHIAAYTESMGDTYRMLGGLLGMEAEAERLAVYCEDVYKRAVDIAGSVEKTGVIYLTGSEGLNVIASGSYHAEILDLLTNNLAVVDEPSSKGTGNEVDMEQILVWDPDFIIFSPGSVYDTVAADGLWQNVRAISEGNYAESPIGPYNWMGFPASVQRLLGVMWMAKLLYPEAADYDLYEEAARYYELFYHCELSTEQYDALVANSIGR